MEGDRPVQHECIVKGAFHKSRIIWKGSLKIGDKFLQKLIIYKRPIANKYCEGKLKSTLKREFKEPETEKAERIAI